MAPKGIRENITSNTPPSRLKRQSDVTTTDTEKVKKKRNVAKKDITTNESVNSESVSTDGNDIGSSPPSGTKTKREKAVSHQVLTDRDDLPRLWNDDLAIANGSYTFRIASWNVAGLRAILTKTPNAFVDLVTRHNLDVLCLQETKLQETHLSDPKLNIVETMALSNEYDNFWSCSTAKKGYAGTAVFLRRRGNGMLKSNMTKTYGSKKQTTMMQFVVEKEKEKDAASSQKSSTTNSNDLSSFIDAELLIPTNVSYVMGKEKHDAEGRIVAVDYPLFSLCNVYVPNAGQKLERLSYRVDEWDKDFLQFIHEKQKERGGLPIMWLGDLNVAHTNLEVWNDGAKHLPKQAGVTPQERASFQEQLDSGYVDAFRRLHPAAAGHYSYWSTRAGNRVVNKGLRLDYFICDPSMFDEKSRVVVRDCYMDYTQEGSDHCPVILELEIKGQFP